MKGVMMMRTTFNISEDLIREVESLYKADSRSKAVESALKDAVRLKKLKAFMELKGNIDIDEETVRKIREAELDENEDNS
jgi:Arc/MetJ family transcription regulator